MGRPRKDGPREPNGRASRSEPDEKQVKDNQATVMAYRMKVFGLTEYDAKDQRAATYIGRLCLAYEAGERVHSLSPEQYHGALDFIRAHHAYQRAMGGPVDFTEHRDLWSLSGEPDPVLREQKYERFCLDAKKRWSEIQKTVQGHQLQTGSKAGWDFLRLAVLGDHETPTLVPAGREVLNLLADKPKVHQRAAA